MRAVLTIRSFCAWAAALGMAASAGASEIFDFDSGTPLPWVHEPIPLTYAAGAITASFTSPDGAVFSVQDYGQTFMPLAVMSGRYLYPSDQGRHHLVIDFSQPLTAISFSFATVELMDQVEFPDNIQLTVSGPGFTDTALAKGTWLGAYPQGTLSYQSAAAFTSADIYVPYFTPAGATNFILDNVTVTAAPTPEPGSLALLAGGLVLAFRYRRPEA